MKKAKFLSIKLETKIAKLLRLQTSNNAGEAANAAAFVEKLCAKYNVSSSDCQDYDPNRDEVIEFASGKSYVKANVPEQTLIYAVARYFNGRTIITYEHEGLPYYLAPRYSKKSFKNNCFYEEIKSRLNCILNI